VPANACNTGAQPSSSSANPGEFYQKTSTTATPTTTSSSTSTSTTTTTTTTTTSAASPVPSASTNSGATGLDTPFPDGELSCGTFPSEYGPIPLDYLGLSGYTGIQSVTIAGNQVTNIVNAATGSTCGEGDMCSYACPPGYQKSQWPSTQGASGQSVGGITCTGGKLYKTNAAYDTLCISGVGGVTVSNTLGEQVAFCRTDYPGYEAETVPLGIQPGQTQPITVPEEDSYYQWGGADTSAQWYLNLLGIGTEQGCQWGTPGSNLGNYAPINAGTGAKGGLIWLSLIPNEPTTDAKLNYNVKIEGSNGSGVCKYEGGQFYDSNGPNSKGCTASFPMGSSAQYVLY